MPAVLAREVLIRNAVVKRGAWLAFIVICFALALSAAYEPVEWAVATGDAADAFFGSQGHARDTQSDMLLALVGASAALLLLSRLHDRQLSTVMSENQQQAMAR